LIMEVDPASEMLCDVTEQWDHENAKYLPPTWHTFVTNICCSFNCVTIDLLHCWQNGYHGKIV
jgi:hypothetical protein